MGISALLASQILDASATGRSVLTGVDASAIRTTLGLGTLATQSPTGTPSASTFLRGDYSWQTIDLSGYVPYSGATGAVNLGSNAFTASQATLSAGTLNGTVLDIAQTWGGTGTYTGIKYNVTDSGPANAASLLMDLQVGGNTRFAVGKDGSIYGSSSFNIRTSTTASMWFNGATTGVVVRASLGLHSTNGAGAFEWALYSGGANICELRNSTNAQTFRIYNTFTDSSNYERAKLAWESNVLRIGTEKLGTGSARALELQTDGTTRLTISTTGNITLGTATGTRLFFANAAGAPSITDYSNSGISVLGQDGAVGTLNTGNVICRNTGFIYWSGRALMTSSANGVVHVQNFDMNESVNQVLCLGPATSSTNGVRLRRAVGTTVVDFRNGNDTDYADIAAKAATFSGNVTLSTVNLVTDTTTGTKIGTATTQKLGFFNATPVVQPTAVADATDAASVITQLNALLSRMRDLGLIAI